MSEDTVQTETDIKVTALVLRPSKDVILSEDDAQPWRAFMQDQIACRKKIEERFKPLKDAAFARHKAIVAKEKELIAEFLKGENDAKRKLAEFVTAENARRAEEARKAQEEAERKAIAEAKAAGDKALATAIKKGEVPVVSEAPPPEPVKIAGFSTRTEKRGKVTNKFAFLKWVVRTGNIGLVDVNERELNIKIRQQQGTQKIDGVQFYDKPVNSAR